MILIGCTIYLYPIMKELLKPEGRENFKIKIQQNGPSGILLLLGLEAAQIFLPILPRNAKIWFIDNQQIFYFIFLIIWITGIAGRLISPVIGWMTNKILGLAMTIFKIS